MITHDFSKFHRALNEVKKWSKKDDAEIVNKALKDVGFRAMQFTPKTDAATIAAELTENNLLIRIAAASLKRQGIKATKQAIGDEANRILKKRENSSGYRRAGWIPAVKAFGGTVRGAKLNSGPSVASQGYGEKATTQKLEGIIANAVYGIQKGPNGATSAAEMEAALMQAIEFVAEDRRQYAEKLKGKTLRKYSDAN